MKQIDQKTMAARTPDSIVIPARLRATGVAYDNQEYDPALPRIAVSVLDFIGGAAGADGISGPVWRLNLHRLDNP